MQHYSGWGYRLQDYSEQQLTHKSGRLIAPDGLANEMQRLGKIDIILDHALDTFQKIMTA